MGSRPVCDAEIVKNIGCQPLPSLRYHPAVFKRTTSNAKVNGPRGVSNSGSKEGSSYTSQLIGVDSGIALIEEAVECGVAGFVSTTARLDAL
ncbi:hypothetical protein VTI28DRAFT_1363 [Corynascus sepedonium]